MDYEIGDVVLLKSGGPAMTVDMVIDNNSKGPLLVIYNQLRMRGFTGSAILCKWFDEPTNSFKQDYFKIEMIKKK